LPTSQASSSVLRLPSLSLSALAINSFTSPLSSRFDASPSSEKRSLNTTSVLILPSPSSSFSCMIIFASSRSSSKSSSSSSSPSNLSSFWVPACPAALAKSEGAPSTSSCTTLPTSQASSSVLRLPSLSLSALAINSFTSPLSSRFDASPSSEKRSLNTTSVLILPSPSSSFSFMIISASSMSSSKSSSSSVFPCLISACRTSLARNEAAPPSSSATLRTSEASSSVLRPSLSRSTSPIHCSNRPLLKSEFAASPSSGRKSLRTSSALSLPSPSSSFSSMSICASSRSSSMSSLKV